jgi:glycosyltransferase involved in cell wall biosynthesis
MPKVSIILTIYNWEKFIKETITSVLNQSYKNFELIIINDYSKDNSEDIINSFNDERIIYIKNEINLNIVKSRNIWITKSNWDYVCFLDQDDIFLENKLEEQIIFLEKNPNYWLVWCNIINIDENSNIIWETLVPESNKIIKNRLLRSSQFACWAVMIRKSILDKVGFLDNNFIKTDDYDLWLRIWTISKLHNLQKKLFRYRYHLNNISNSSVKEMTIKWIKLCIKYRKYYPNFYLSLFLWILYLIIPITVSKKILSYTK